MPSAMKIAQVKLLRLVQNTPIDEAIDHTPNAVALSLGFSKITLIIERVVGIIKAPAIPSKNRIAITNSALSAKI